MEKARCDFLPLVIFLQGLLWGGGLAVFTGCTPARGPVFVLSTDAGDGPAGSREPCRTSCASLPLVVDGEGHFVPSGYMGDFAQGAITETTSRQVPEACIPSRAHPAAVGACHHFIWNYSNGICPTTTNPAQQCEPWACVAWVKPGDFFLSTTQGASAGLPVAAGATQVRFWAWAKEATIIRFSVGSASEGLYAESTLQLTPDPTEYALPITNATYNRVNTGFLWCTSDAEKRNVDFYVDDIQWR